MTLYLLLVLFLVTVLGLTLAVESAFEVLLFDLNLTAFVLVPAMAGSTVFVLVPAMAGPTGSASHFPSEVKS